MQMAEQIGLMFAQARVIDKRGNHKGPVAIPIHVTHQHDDYAPMELGTTATFCGECHLCGRFGHKASSCTKGKLPPAHTGTNRRNGEGKKQAKFNNLE